MSDLGMAFEVLVRSTRDLHVRFQTSQALTQALACLDEEVLEFKAEAETPIGPRKPVAEECADVIVTLLGVLRAWQITPDELADAMIDVAMKNDNKTHMTHAVNAAGKIARKG